MVHDANEMSKTWIIVANVVGNPAYGPEFFLCNIRNTRLWSLCRAGCFRFETEEDAKKYLIENPLPEHMTEDRFVYVTEYKKNMLMGMTHGQVYKESLLSKTIS